MTRTRLTIAAALATAMLATVAVVLLNRTPSGMKSVPSAAPATSVPSAAPAITAPPTAAGTSAPSTARLIQFCGEPVRYASDGAHMLLTLKSGDLVRQFRLEYQFAAGSFPRDIGERLARGESQVLRVQGEEVEPDSGAPDAVNLRNFVLDRVRSCP